MTQAPSLIFINTAHFSSLTAAATPTQPPTNPRGAASRPPAGNTGTGTGASGVQLKQWNPGRAPWPPPTGTKGYTYVAHTAGCFIESHFFQVAGALIKVSRCDMHRTRVSTLLYTAYSNRLNIEFSMRFSP